MKTLRIQPAKRIAGEIRPPSDKSITHRALLFAALAEQESYIKRALTAEDCLDMRACLTRLGLQITEDGPGLRLKPVAWASPDEPLDCGNSGTAMRLLAGAIASHDGLVATLVGDESLSGRPMKRVTEPLRQMGAEIEGITAPLKVSGARLRGLNANLDVASAQVKSAILIAGLRASRETTVHEPSQSRDHTERMLTAIGAIIHRGDRTATIEPGPLRGFEARIPGDLSSAAFWIVAATLLHGSELILHDLGTNPTRTGLFDILRDPTLENQRENLSEPVAEMVIERPNLPAPFLIEGDLVPRLIDEIPILAVLGTQLSGTSIIKDASELRVKESDRIAKTAEFLNEMGAAITLTEDGMIIEGPTPLRGGIINSGGDHRIAMSAVIAGLVAEQETMVNDVECIATSYPDFVQHMEKLVEY